MSKPHALLLCRRRCGGTATRKTLADMIWVRCMHYICMFSSATHKLTLSHTHTHTLWPCLGSKPTAHLLYRQRFSQVLVFLFFIVGVIYKRLATNKMVSTRGYRKIGNKLSHWKWKFRWLPCRCWWWSVRLCACSNRCDCVIVANIFRLFLFSNFTSGTIELDWMNWQPKIYRRPDF